MSPEQARGRPVDKRADIWAFGCVLYEMLTGKRAFEAEDVSLTLAEVMKGEPDLRVLPQEAPAAVRVVLKGCLQKDPRQRIRDIGDVRLALGNAFETHVEPSEHLRADVPQPPVWKRLAPWVAIQECIDRRPLGRRRLGLARRHQVDVRRARRASGDRP